MKKGYLLVLLLFVLAYTSKAQDKAISPTLISKGQFHGLSRPLRDIPAMTADEFDKMEIDAAKPRNEEMRERSYPFANKAFPKGDDPAWQRKMGNTNILKATGVSFDGQTSPYYPPDCNGAAGPGYFMQTINCVYAIYNKTGALVSGPANMNTLFTGVTGATCNDGDPIVLYDEQADRWVAIEFSICGSNDYMLFAISQTNNPTGAWYRYSFDVDDMPDYEKVGIWQDGYYMGTNNSSAGKRDIYVFNRAQMLSGAATAQMVAFDNPWRPTTIDGFMCVPPVDNDGVAAPAGSPGLFITMNDDAIAGGTDQLWIYELAVNWTTPASSTFNRVQQLNVPAFDSNFGNNWTNIKQPGTTQELDAIPQVIMNAPQYRNFGAYQTLVCCHTVDVDATDHAGVRWYELRKTSGTWSLRQSGTYAPDAHSRWMGSIRLNGQGEIGLGYSISSSSVYPGIRYTGQSSAAYAQGAGVLDIPEQTITTGTVSQTTYERWGDYSSISVDPSDDKTFWYTTEYIGSGGTRKSRIASFAFASASPQPDLVVQTAAVTPVSANDGSTVTASATVVNQGAASAGASTLNYYLSTNNTFESGTDVLLGSDAIAALSAAGSTNVSKLLTIPAGTAAGTYFVLFAADATSAVIESSETNNLGSFQITVTSALGPADLTVLTPAATPLTVNAGQTTTASCSIKNLNAGPASVSNLKYYLSTDAVYSTNDLYLATDATAALAGNATANFSKVVTIPATTAAGTSYILFFADADAQVAESNETNNVGSVAITVVAPVGCNSTTQYPSNTLSPTTSWKSQKSIWAGDFTAFNVTSGRVYTFSYCAADGATASYNSELTLRNKADNSLLAYSNDACGDDASIVWTATFTGVVKLVTTVSGCGTNTTSSTLRYKYAAKAAEGIAAAEPDYLVYPNPTKGKVTVEATSGFENVKQIVVCDASGKAASTIDVPAKSDNIYEIDLSDQKSGMFLVKIIGSDKTEQFKVMLKK